MVTTIGSIRVDLDADLGKLSAQFDKGRKIVDREGARIGKRVQTIDGEFTRLGSTMQKVGAIGGTFTRSLAAGLAAGGGAAAIAGVRQIARGVAEIGDAARRAGVDVEAFQRLAYVAQQNRIPVDALTDSLKELSLRADEFLTTGAGPAAEAFARIGLAGDELREALQDPSDLLVTIIGRLERFDRAAQIRIADELFGGTGGERLVQLIDQGAAGIRRTINEAERLGVILEQDVIDRADKIDKAFNRIASTVGTNLKGAVVTVADELKSALDLLRDLDRRSVETLRRQIADAEAANARARAWFGDASSTFTQNNDRTIADLRAEIARRGIAAGPTRVPTRDEWLSRPEPVTDPGGGGSSSRARSIAREVDAYQRLITTTQARLASLEAERAGIGQTDAAAAGLAMRQQMLNRATQQGVDLSPEQRARIEELAGEYGRLRAQTDAAREAQDGLQNAMDGLQQTGADTIASLIDGTFNWRNAVRDLIPVVSDLISELSRANRIGAGGGGGGIGGLVTTGLGFVSALFREQGGDVGHFGPRVAVPAAAFANAPRFKGGFHQDEFPAVLHEGEKVLNAMEAKSVTPTMRGLTELAGGGMSRVRISLSPGLEAELLEEARIQAVEIVDDNNRKVVPDIAAEAAAESYSNDPDPRWGR